MDDDYNWHEGSSRHGYGGMKFNDALLSGVLKLSPTTSTPQKEASGASFLPAALAEDCPVLAWRCAFLGCGALRVWEGGRAGFNLPTCHRCGCAIATSVGERKKITPSVKYLI